MSGLGRLGGRIAPHVTSPLQTHVHSTCTATVTRFVAVGDPVW